MLQNKFYQIHLFLRAGFFWPKTILSIPKVANVKTLSVIID